jgi:hypothetical protein
LRRVAVEKWVELEACVDVVGRIRVRGIRVACWRPVP